MSRYIDAELLKRKSKLLYIDGKIEIVYKKDQIDNAPTADVKEVIRGEWKPLHSHFSPIRPSYGCSNCKGYNDYKSNYCPNCGAHMKGE